jgi:hypothetical protein
MNSLELGKFLKERYTCVNKGEQVSSIHLFGIEFGNSEKGLYLDEDSQQMPLGSCGV